jgi:hypothetical protein
MIVRTLQKSFRSGGEDIREGRSSGEATVCISESGSRPLLAATKRTQRFVARERHRVVESHHRGFVGSKVE